MPDITMCTGEEHDVQRMETRVCEKRESCYRYHAKPNELGQSYFSKPPFVSSDKVHYCDHYWERYK